tara:strand:- start:158 stop:1252 length:1095 start_codon:yes stop_codon:yes gene_type:complete
MQKYNSVLIRVDFNTPIDESGIKDTYRIDACLEEIRYWQMRAKRIIIISHLGRPKGYDKALSLALIGRYMEKCLNMRVPLVRWPGDNIDSEGIFLAENIRFFSEEYDNDTVFSKSLSSGIDHFVFDAFSVAHRQHASSCGVFEHVKSMSYGKRYLDEIKALHLITQKTSTRSVIMAGSKTETKIPLIESILPHTQHLLLGGVIANTFLAATGVDMGQSKVDHDALQMALDIMEKAKQLNTQIHLPVDGKNKSGQVVSLDNEETIYDVGPETLSLWRDIISQSSQVIWNGSLGFYEDHQFDASKQLAEFLANLDIQVIVGGGDTLAVIQDPASYTHVSTGGGAFLYYWENKRFPFEELIKEKDME